MVLALICCPRVQVLAARDIGKDTDEFFPRLPKGEIGEAASPEDRRKRARELLDVPADPYDDYRRNRG
eukprot:14425844-Alexandrium_andersonii.AAC.1